MTTVRRLWLAFYVMVACFGCGRPWNPRITEVQSPALIGASAEPQLSTFGDRTILSWIERKSSAKGDADVAWLKFSERTATGWTAPAVAATGDDWFLNWADVPSVVRISSTLLAAHWLESNGPDPEGYDVRVSFSRDDGKTWSAATSPHHDGTPTEHGFASLFPAHDGGLGMVWLDGRAGETMSIRSATFSSDGTQTSEAVVHDRVCECCPTAAVVTGDGVIAAFRNLGDNQVRDIHVARMAGDKWSTPSAVHNDDWRIDACPVNGPALSADGQTVAVAWFNAKVDQGHVFAAFSNDGGRSFGEAIRVDDASALGRVDVALLSDGSAAVAWIEFVEGRSQFRIRRVSANGALTPSTVVSALASGRASGYPRLARAGQELIFAWTELQNGKTTVRTASWMMER
jgi:hypothetical protein